jgi:predicted ribonuclease YlaK
MAKKIINYNDVPKTLDDHPFYGLKLDDEQKAFRDSIWDDSKLIIFCDARAGTGKTTVATMTANLLCLYHKCDGIVYIASPVQESRLGFLPGSADQKSEPYFEPFIQAALKANINPMTAINQKASMDAQKEGSAYIDCITHVYLRGVNFSKKVILIDESQNYSVSELKKTLTRCDDTCKVVVIGHSGQCDLANAGNSGFAKYIKHFEGDSRCAVCHLTKNYRGWISSHADELV